MAYYKKCSFDTDNGLLCKVIKERAYLLSFLSYFKFHIIDILIYF